MKALPKLIRRLFFAGIMMGLTLLMYLQLGQDVAKDIRAQELLWTSNGWVNFGHANPSGVKVFIDDLNSRWAAAPDKPFEVTYGQRMKGNYFGLITVQARLERVYRITNVSSKQELDRIAWGIFREVADAFETMQGSFPNAIDASSQDSSFRNGDLMGNRIAFYRALRGYTKDQVNAWLHPMSVEDSLRHFQQAPMAKNSNWDVPPELAGGPLDELIHDAVWFASHASRLKEKQCWFRVDFLGWR
jgi:hypothetical protein